jgi:hypothetical protein
MRPVLIPMLCSAIAVVPAPARAADTLKVIVVDGDEAANIVAERLAAEPVIEVRDKDDRRVPGAVVRFVIRKTRDRLLASFGNGQTEVRTLTDYAGRAGVNGVSPIEPGSFQIDVDVSYRGQTGKAVIRQTNFPTTADARSAGREPAKNSSSTAQGSAAGAAATGAGAATTATTAATTTATAASVGAGGGMSKLAVIGLVAGGAAGAGAAAVLSRREAEPAAARVAAVVPNQTGGVLAASRFTFSAEVTGFDAASVTYRWDFGDGATSTEPTPAHVYTTPGTFTVSVTVSDRQQSSRSETSITVHSLDGRWTSTGGSVSLDLSQSALTIAGEGARHLNGRVYSCPVTGAIEPGAPVVMVIGYPRCSLPGVAGYMVAFELRLSMAVGGQELGGTMTFVEGPETGRTDPIVFRR